MVDRRCSRRSGRLIKTLTNRSSIVSKYTFNNAESETSKMYSRKKRNYDWIPPRSPYALIQEDLYSDPWQLLVATVFLTKTSAEKAIPQIHKFLIKFPSAESVLKAKREDISSFLSPLGLGNIRTETIARFSREYLSKDWNYPDELYGIGKYGNDSYRIFCIGEWRQTCPDDVPLTMYRNWLLDNCYKLGI